MSIKIYNGLVLPKKTLSELMVISREIREQLSSFRTEQIRRNFMKELAERSDLYWLEQIKSDPWQKSHELFNQKFKEAEKGVREKDVDFSFEIVFIPYKNKILLMPFTEHEFFIDTLKKIPGIKEYQYYNHTDRPKEISSQEWKKRGQVWDKALESTPAKSGLTMTIFDLTDQS